MELQAGLMLRIRYHQYGWPNCILRLQDEVHRVIVQLFLSFYSYCCRIKIRSVPAIINPRTGSGCKNPFPKFSNGCEGYFLRCCSLYKPDIEAFFFFRKFALKLTVIGEDLFPEYFGRYCFFFPNIGGYHHACMIQV